MRLHTKLNHKIWHLAWPMIISNLSVPMLGLVDTAILGHLESAHFLAAVAVGSSLLSFLYWGFGFLRMGTTGLTAQAYGAQQHNQNRLIIGQSVVLGLLLGIAIFCLSPLLLELGFTLVSPPAGAEQLASSYAHIRIFSAPAVLINYAITGWLIGQQNTRWPLLIALFTNVLNIVLDYIFIILLDMKSDGAAVATLIAEYSGCVMALMIMRRQLLTLPGKLDFQRLWRWKDYQELLMVNRHLFIRTLALLASFAFFTAQGAKQGEVILAANTIIMNLLLLTAFGLDGFAHAAEALVGDAVGKRNQQAFKDTCFNCAYWSLATALLFTFVYWVLGPSLIALLTSIDHIQIQATKYLPWLLALPLVAVWSYLLDGIFIGATRTGPMQITMLFSTGFVYLPCWYFTQHWGNDGLWFAFIAFNAARGLSLGIYFYFYSNYDCWWEKSNN